MNNSVNRETYDWVLSTLTEGYMRGNLIAGSTCGCAIGNLLTRRFSEINGREPEAYEMVDLGSWCRVFSTGSTTYGYPGRVIIKEEGPYCQASRPHGTHELSILHSLHVPLNVLMDIEWAFETNQTGLGYQEQTLNGLCALIEVLSKHAGIDGTEDIQALRSQRQVEALEQQLETILSSPNTEDYDNSSCNTCSTSQTGQRIAQEAIT